MRRVASVIAGAAVAAVGGLVLGEYPFTGWTPWVAGVLFALVVTEVMITIGRTHGPVVGIGGGVFSAGGLGWAVWISSGRGVEPIASGGWLAIALGFAVAMVRGFLPVIRRAPAPAAGAVGDESPTALERLDEFIAPAATTLAISRSGRVPASGLRHGAEGSFPPSSGRPPETPPDAPLETTAAGTPGATPGPATPGPAAPGPETATPPAVPATATPRRPARTAPPAKKAAATTKRTPAGRVSTAKQAAPAAKARQATKGAPAKKATSASKKSGAAKAAPTKRDEKAKTASTAKKAGAASAGKAAAVKAAKSPAPRSRSGGR